MKKIILVLMIVLILGMVGKVLYTALARFDTHHDAERDTCWQYMIGKKILM